MFRDPQSVVVVHPLRDWHRAEHARRRKRSSEINLAVTENLAALYPQLISVTAASKKTQTVEPIASTKRNAHRFLTEASQASWEDWPAGSYSYSTVTFTKLPSGPAFMQLNQTLRALHMSNWTPASRLPGVDSVISGS